MNKNADGSVDILDAQGNVVEHVQAPWAYDVSGRKVPTWYEVGEDNRLVQVVDPQRTTALPVVADPDRKKKATASPYKSKSTKGSQKPPRQKIKGIGQPPSSQKGSGKPTSTAPKPSAPKTTSAPKPSTSAKPSPKPQQPVKQPEVKTLPPGSPRRKITAVGHPPQQPTEDPLVSGRNLLNSPPADPNKASAVPEGQFKPVRMHNPDGTVNPNYYRDFPKIVDVPRENDGTGKHVRPGKDPLPPDYSKVGKPLPPKAPRRKITAVGGPQPDPYAQERSGKSNNTTPNQKVNKASVAKGKEEGKGFRKGTKDKIRSGAKRINDWGRDKFEDSDKSIEKRENSDSRVKRGLAKGERIIHRGTKAVYESVGDGIAASAPLVGLGKDGGSGVKESWRDGPGALVGASDEVSPKEAWKTVGKEAIAYDEWKNKEYPEAVALTATNLIGLKGIDKVGRGIKPKKPAQPVPQPKATPKPSQSTPRVQEQKPIKPVADTPKTSQIVNPRPVSPRVVPPQQVPMPKEVAKVDPTPAWYRAEGQNADTVPPAIRNEEFFPDQYRPYGDLTHPEFVEKWGPGDNPKWPPKNGFVLDSEGNPITTLVNDIPEGTVLDRIGNLEGKFLGDAGDSFPMRSMHPDRPFEQYTKVIRTDKPLPDNIRVRFGEIAPAFEQPGGGTQYLFERIIDMENGVPKVTLVSLKELMELGVFRKVI
ncbi:glycohydrolase toxin TNT-related protein [Corynebacterium sp. 22KM0430]|uniref:glycohydrolase toxin TNT-related protein n=1 Tax=Corynebacterium sp. 22KM0430 TaxID=2989735 RepID=UPI0029C9B882|nr:glycohydrolase toxin TNT-related protein [Corynebacterium sp. 22KM0430]WPF65418.1 glycohydrolase toxin TNT-related protein [Corynebacterium sp. 22KM0430]